MAKKFSNLKMSKRNLDFVLVIIAFLLATYLDWSLELAAALAFSVFCFLSEFNSEFYRNLAIIFAILSAILLAINNQQISEKLGIVSFISLIVYIFYQSVIYRRNHI